MDTSEKDFESYIVEDLVHSGYVERDPKKHYDRSRCLDSEALFSFIYATQPEEWEKLKRQYGEEVKEKFLARLTKEIDRRDTLDLFRRGIKDRGCTFRLAYFKPETGLNAEHQRLYDQNIFSVMRQVRFSERDEKSLDLVIFLNGVPIITVELKTPLTGQNVQDAVSQYRKSRDPREPIFAFGRCLAHFAADPDLVYMNTHLKGEDTLFLPFNKGTDGGAGNPENPDGFKTDYLWREVFQRDSLLEIIDQFLNVVELEDDKGKKTGKKALIFPRYHQLQSVRNLISDARDRGAGRNYLIQHSAGSGKSNSIAWLAHRLTGLHDSADERVFDAVVVVTDRKVLDRQLQKTVRDFEQVRGTVTNISGSKAQSLKDALETGAQIMVCTLQTFPFVTEGIRQTPGRRFAVIIDEAHSSQSGESSRSLKEVLSAGSLNEAEEEDPAGESDEDRVNKNVEGHMKTRGRVPNVSFFAFTATPKAKTMEIFGSEKSDSTYGSFSLYSMRQAMEEGFILDVLQNYTTFKVYFNLNKKVEEDPRYDRKKAVSLLKSYADLHEHAIREKARQMVEHFHEQIQDRIGARAKAMLVTRSRLHAVRYKLAFDRYLKEAGYPYEALVAFSGTVHDPERGGLEFTESQMNGYPDTRTAEIFKGSRYRFMIVANKFQTGFDQPLLHTMYVDKKLGGVNAVQTLSRLNRTHPNKEDTCVLDFANEAREIQDAFQDYYETTLLAEPTDPNKLYDLKLSLEDYQVFEPGDVEGFAAEYFSPAGRQQGLHSLLDLVVREYMEREKDEQSGFKKLADDYVRLYAFLSQILTFTDDELEKLYQFLRFLVRKLPVEEERLPVEITENINMDSYRIQQTSTGSIKLLRENGELAPASELGPAVPEEDQAPLSEILAYVNEYYGTEFTDEDRIAHFADDMERRLKDQSGLRRGFDTRINPSEEHRRLAFEQFFGDAFEDMMDSNFELYKKIVEDEQFGKMFKELLFDRIQRDLPPGSGQ